MVLTVNTMSADDMYPTRSGQEELYPFVSK